jgi:hypothetical protein
MNAENPFPLLPEGGCPRKARQRLRRRICHAAVRRFVNCAQDALPRDGPKDVLLARRLVARFARLERRSEELFF